MKTSNQIRQEFIEFFEKKKHTFVPSAPVVPLDDPTLLFNNAGMNQFKDVFLNTGTRPYNRAANSQKCIRVSGKHNDLEEVGHDNYHHTYFEMLGNWSFGNYFKKDAIAWAWELLTEVWGIPKERLYATVFGGDEGDGLAADAEAENLWKEVTDIDPSHILRCDKKDNFWEMGEMGPCGPCSEIHIDMTSDLSGASLVNADSDQVIEIWNLVFVQYNRKKDSSLELLPAQHVDTGMGFERIVRVLQNVNSNYDTDIFTPILAKIGALANLEYAKVTDDQKAAFQVIADHIRMLTFSISDGAMPGNEGRGYVLRRILRRAARYARKLEMYQPFIYEIVPTVVELYGDAFPEIVDKAEYVMQVIKAEEESFNRTLDRGIERFNKIAATMAEKKQSKFSGEEAFKLYDTFGFPFDLTQVMAQELGLTIDQAGFDTEMEQQRDRARKAGKFSMQETADTDWVKLTDAESEFVGYHNLDVETQVHKYIQQGEKWQVVLAQTPFYGESGGQVGDKGTITGEGFVLSVEDTQKENGQNICICTLAGEAHFKDATVKAVVNAPHRKTTTYNHTATHLLHAALRQVLGDHVGQKGSLVHPDHLRFDFSHFQKVEADELEKIEWIVNEKIQDDLAVETETTDFKTAKAKGAMALFGEKYGDVVRMVSIEPFSLELCGGCHVNHTGQIGPFVITQESSVASGVRRIEALTGPKAIAFIQNNRNIVRDLDDILSTPPNALADKVKEMQQQIKSLEKELSQIQAGQVLEQVDEFIKSAENLGNAQLIIQEFKDVEVDLLKQLGDSLRQKSPQTVSFLVNRAAGGNVNFVCAVTDDLIKEKKLKAGDLVREAAKLAGGGGGGRPHLATAGAKQAEKLTDVYKFLREKISSI